MVCRSALAQCAGSLTRSPVRRATGAAVATVAALMFRYISTSDFLFLRNAYFLGCFYVVDLPSFSLHRWYTDNEFFRYFSSL
jgi:hypothetical protein